MVSTIHGRVDVLKERVLTIAAPVRQRWQGLPRRGQQSALLIGSVLLILLFWSVLWRPLLQQHARLQTSLPTMATQLAAMRTQSEEIKRLVAVPAASGTVSASRRLADVASVQQVMGETVAVQLNSKVQFVLSAKQISYRQFIDRLDALLAAADLRLLSLNVAAVPATTTVGLVSIDAVLVDSNRREPTPAATK